MAKSDVDKENACPVTFVGVRAPSTRSRTVHFVDTGVPGSEGRLIRFTASQRMRYGKKLTADPACVPGLEFTRRNNPRSKQRRNKVATMRRTARGAVEESSVSSQITNTASSSDLRSSCSAGGHNLTHSDVGTPLPAAAESTSSMHRSGSIGIQPEQKSSSLSVCEVDAMALKVNNAKSNKGQVHRSRGQIDAPSSFQCSFSCEASTSSTSSPKLCSTEPNELAAGDVGNNSSDVPCSPLSKRVHPASLESSTYNVATLKSPATTVEFAGSCQLPCSNASQMNTETQCSVQQQRTPRRQLNSSSTFSNLQATPTETQRSAEQDRTYQRQLTRTATFSNFRTSPTNVRTSPTSNSAYQSRTSTSAESNKSSSVHHAIVFNQASTQSLFNRQQSLPCAVRRASPPNISGGAYAGAKFSSPPAARELPRPPTHWL